MFYYHSDGAPVGSGPALEVEYLPAYILDSAPDFNLSLMKSSDMITRRSTNGTITSFSFFLISLVLLFHGDPVNC